MGKDVELLSFDFSLFKNALESISCPNCGFHFHRTTTSLLPNGLSKSLLILGCGTVLYMNCHKKNILRSVLFRLGNTFQYYGSSLLAFLNHNTKSDSNLYESTYQYQASFSNQLSSTILYDDSPNEETNDLSIAFSSLNSIGSSTVAKFDYLLDQVQHIKDCVNESYSDFSTFSSPQYFRAERRLSDGELTLPSLEWDLEDMSFLHDNKANDGHHHFGGKKQSFLYNVKYNGIVDAELLSQIIFNKDFDFKDRIYDQIHLRKHFASLRHRLKNSTKNTFCTNVKTKESLSYRSNRDSAYFEE